MHKIDTLEIRWAFVQLGSITLGYGIALKAKATCIEALKEYLGHITNEADNSKNRM
jgi:hypothetical protein